MTFERVMYAFGMTSVYFGIYYFWQYATGLVFDIITVSALGASGLEGAMLEAVYTDTVTAYALHVTFFSHLLTLITYLLVLTLQKKSVVRELEIRRISPAGCVLMLILGVSLGIFITVLFSVIPFPESWISAYVEKSSMLTKPALWVTVLVTVISAPIVEEVVFRGFVESKLKLGFSMFASMVISSVLFGLVHASLLWMIYAGIVGFVLALMREKYRSLIASVLVHMGFNLCGVVLGYFEHIHMAVFIGSGAVSVGIIAYVIVTSKHKIEFFMPKNEQNTEYIHQK